MAREAVIPSQGCTVAGNAHTTRPGLTSRKANKDACTQSEPVTKLGRTEDHVRNPKARDPDEDQDHVPAKWTSSLTSADPNEATTYIARTDEDLIPALRLVCDSVAQQRQLAARSLLLHPICWLSILATISYLIVERAHDSSDWLVILITIACMMMVVMTVVKIVVRGYLDEAEKVGRWSWLHGQRWMKIRFPPLSFEKREEQEDYVFITRLGNEIIGTIVLRLTNTWEHDMSTYHRKKVCIRAWTVVRRYRGRGVGLALLRFVVRWALDNDLEFIFFDDDHAHSLRVLPASLNRKMDELDARAKDTLYWEVKHYSTPWFKEQREERKMKLAQVKDRSSCRGLSQQHDFTERRGRLASRTLPRNSLEKSSRRGLDARLSVPSLSSMDTDVNDHSNKLHPSVIPEDSSWTLNATDEAGSDAANFTVSDGGSVVEDVETPRKEKCIQTAINEPEQSKHKCREGRKHTLSTGITDSKCQLLKLEIPKDIILHTRPRSERDSADSVRFDSFSLAQTDVPWPDESHLFDKHPKLFDAHVDGFKEDLHSIEMSGRFCRQTAWEHGNRDPFSMEDTSSPCT
jgi:GNAT superfamily N-acetyltransferase